MSAAAAVIVPPLPTDRRAQVIRVLQATAYGLQPAGRCAGCLVLQPRPRFMTAASRRCRDCRQALADVDTLNAAVTAVVNAGTDAEAYQLYDAVMLSLAGALVTATGGAE